MTAYAQALIVREPFEADLPTATLDVSAPFPTTASPETRVVSIRFSGEDGEVCFTGDDLDELRDAVAQAIATRDRLDRERARWPVRAVA